MHIPSTCDDRTFFFTRLGRLSPARRQLRADKVDLPLSLSSDRLPAGPASWSDVFSAIAGEYTEAFDSRRIALG